MEHERHPFSLSVIVPVYNECAALENGLRTISDFLVSHGLDHEILVVESGSTDGTYQKCDELGRVLPNVRVIHEGARNGFGAAVKLGYRHATKDLLWLITVDLFFPLEAIFAALPLLTRVDYVTSYRSTDNRGVRRKLQSFVYNKLITTVLGLKVRHVNAGFKVLKREIAQGIDLTSKGWFVDAELLYRLEKAGRSQAEIPVPLIDRTQGKSSVGALAFVAVLKELWAFLRTQKQNR
jgi:glycosyltransferase involved in cell wall biosynthesis